MRDVKRRKSKSQAKAEPRRRGMPRWMRRFLLAVGGVAFVAGYVGGIAHLTRNGWLGARLDEADAWVAEEVADMGFRVRSIEVHGIGKTEATVLRETLGVEEGDPILGLDLTELQRRVERLPWVRAATVERLLPEGLVIRLEERTPIALWQRENDIALIDDTGAVIRGASLTDFRRLPLLAGPGVPDKAPELIEVLAEEPELAARISAGSLVEKRRWNLLVDDRVWIKLPQERAREAWLRLAKEEREQSILSRNILAVDLRNDEQWVFRLPPGERVRLAIEQGGG
jgi:cell division protein FtsQ